MPSRESGGSAHELRVVSNTTPLITLGELGLLDVLRELYGNIYIPRTVLLEYQAGRATHPQRPDLLSLAWIAVQDVPVNHALPTSLDRGERDALALALALQAVRVLIDERAARAVAAQLNLTVTGSAGILLAAKQAGTISRVKPYLDLMLAQGRYISSIMYGQVL